MYLLVCCHSNKCEYKIDSLYKGSCLYEKMSPDSSWSDQFSKSQIKQDLREVEWKNFFNECLMQAEILKKSDLNLLNNKYSSIDQNFRMDMRHEMARSHFSKIFPTPKEQILTEARKLLRAENHKRLAKIKEEKLVKKEIERLKQHFENCRLLGKKDLEENEKTKCRPNLPKFAKRYTKLWKRFESYDGFREIDTWFNKSVQMTMKTKISPNGVPFDVKIQLKKRKDEKETSDNCSELIYHNHKGSVISYEEEIVFEENSPYWDLSQNNSKNEIMQRFFESNNEIGKQILQERPKIVTNDFQQIETFKKDCGTNTEKVEPNKTKRIDHRKSWRNKANLIQAYMNKQRVEHAWKTWRNFVLTSRKRNEEKINYENKIETFLERLKEKDRVLSKKGRNAVSCKTSEKPSQILKKRAKTAIDMSKEKMEEKQKEILENKAEKDQTIRKIIREVKKSRRETYENLVAMEKQETGKNEKVIVLKTLTSVLEKVKDPTRKPFPVPEIVLRMEKRQEDRKKRWKEIRDRKRKLEEERERIQRENEKQKELMKEHEKKKKRQELKERRRLEKEKMEEKRKEKEKMMFLIKLADNNYDKVLLRSYGLKPWLDLMNLRNLQGDFALKFYEKRMKKDMFFKWKAEAKSAAEIKERRAEEVYIRILKRKSFRVWVEVCEERISQFQVAVDWNDFKTMERLFTKWLTLTKEVQRQICEKHIIADLNYENKLKMKYLKLWRFYPELKRLVAAKEERKRIWRQKVQEILPDYQPADISGYLYSS